MKNLFKNIVIVVFVFIMMFFSIEKTSAASTYMTCNYESKDGKNKLTLTVYSDFSNKLVINKYKGKSINNGEKVINWGARSNDYGISHYIKYTGLCPDKAGIIKQVLYGYSVYIGDVVVINNAIKDYSNNAILDLNNTVYDNINNMRAYMNSGSGLSCDYQNKSTIEKIAVPNAFYNGVYYATGGPLNNGLIISTSKCPDVVYKVCSASDKQNCSYTFSLSLPSFCSSSNYSCNKLPDTTTEQPGNPDGGKGIKEFLKNYKVSSIGSTQFGDKLNFSITYDFDKNYSTHMNIVLSGYNGDVKLAHIGMLDTFKGTVLDPIINNDKWPEVFYCASISATMSLSSSAALILGGDERNGVICSTQKASFLGTSQLAKYVLQEENDTTPPPTDSGDNDEDTGGNEVCGIMSVEMADKLRWILDIIKYGGVILAIGLGMFDFAKAVFSDEVDANKKASQKFIKRLIAASIIFIVPLVIQIFLNIIEIDGVDLDNPFCIQLD